MLTCMLQHIRTCQTPLAERLQALKRPPRPASRHDTTLRSTKATPFSATMAPFNCLTTTASELQDLLQQGTLTSVDAVDAYLEQIDRHNDWLKAVIATPPRDQLAARAKFPDDEREEEKMRGPLHGISILIKVSVTKPCAHRVISLTVKGLLQHAQRGRCDYWWMLLARRGESSARCRGCAQSE
jgi:hypothetical protein